MFFALVKFCQVLFTKCFPNVSAVKNPLTMKEMWFLSLGREDSPEKEMATHYSILVWKIPWAERSGKLQSMGSQKSQTRLRD